MNENPVQQQQVPQQSQIPQQQQVPQQPQQQSQGLKQRLSNVGNRVLNVVDRLVANIEYKMESWEAGMRRSSPVASPPSPSSPAAQMPQTQQPLPPQPPARTY